MLITLIYAVQIKQILAICICDRDKTRERVAVFTQSHPKIILLTLLFFSSSNTGFLARGEGDGINVASRGISGSTKTIPEIKKWQQTANLLWKWQFWGLQLHSKSPKNNTVITDCSMRYFWMQLHPYCFTVLLYLISIFQQFLSGWCLTLWLQHLIRFTDFCFLWQRHSPTVQHLDHFCLHSLWYFVS